MGVDIKFTCENTLNLQDQNRINILTDLCCLLVIRVSVLYLSN